MECPYCRGEMEPGRITGFRNPGYWLPKGMGVGLMATKRKIEERGGFRVGRAEFYWDIDAWYCQTCNRLTIFNAK